MKRDTGARSSAHTLSVSLTESTRSAETSAFGELDQLNEDSDYRKMISPEFDVAIASDRF